MHADSLFIDIESVREGDQEAVMTKILGLDTDEWGVEYYRRIERYVVLSQPEAKRLAEELGGEVHTEGGRRARIVWLLHHLEVPVTIRHRAKSKAFVKIYRVAPHRGATAAYRLEAWLKGDRKGKTHFFKKDEAVLDAILERLVVEHDLHPIRRPRVWEGQGGAAPEFAPRDPLYRRMPMKAYRGRRPWKAKCHPPRGGDCGPRLVLGRPSPDLRAAQCISCPSPSSTLENPSGKPFSPGPSLHGEAQLGHQIAHDSVCFISEVVMDAHRDPTPLVRHIVHELGGPGEVAVGYIGTNDTWHGIHTLIEELPAVSDDEMAMVVVAEPDTVSLLIEDTWTHEDGSLDEDALETATFRWALQGERTSCSGLLTNALDGLRKLCETTGCGSCSSPWTTGASTLWPDRRRPTPGRAPSCAASSGTTVGTSPTPATSWRTTGW